MCISWTFVYIAWNVLTDSNMTAPSLFVGCVCGVNGTCFWQLFECRRHLRSGWNLWWCFLSISDAGILAGWVLQTKQYKFSSDSSNVGTHDLCAFSVVCCLQCCVSALVKFRVSFLMSLVTVTNNWSWKLIYVLWKRTHGSAEAWTSMCGCTHCSLYRMLLIRCC